MELLQLRYFCHAAQTQNLSQTAKHYMVPTSNISQCIKRLEKELDAPLFTRTANRITLNENGKRFYEQVSAALTLLDDAKRMVEKKKEITLRICVLIHRRIAMEAIESFRRTHPYCNFITTHTEPDDLLDYDLIISDKEVDGRYLGIIAAEEKFILAYNKDFFSLSDTIEPSMLADMPFITMNSKSSIYQHTISICGEWGFSPRIALQSEDPFYVRTCIELGLGISLVPAVSWRGLFSDAIGFRDMSDHKRKIIVYQKKVASPCAVEFGQHLISHYRDEVLHSG